ncbi:MAG: hypothetical protein KDA85_19810, partial [Planctomycetaceae bacterium]|nr:hypothetical protein [Planctomycetaceae bacterium]
GGGQDGFALASAFVADGVPPGWQGVVITGPCMPATERMQLKRMAGDSRRMMIIDRIVEADHWLRRATRVVTMGGYNSVAAILSFAKPALIVPRIRPRREQWIRAERLRNLGWTSVVSPDGLKPGIIRRWLETDDVARPDRSAVNLNGLKTIGERLMDMFESSTVAAHPCLT